MFIPTSNDVTFTKTAHANSIWGTIKDIGNIYKEGQKAEATKKAKKQIRARTELNISARVHAEEGHKYFEDKDYERAIAEYTKAIELRSDSPLYYDYRGNAYYELGNYNQAIRDYTSSINLDSTGGGGIVFYNRGLAYVGLKDYQTAIADFTIAIQLTSWSKHHIYYTRGKCYEELGDEKKAKIDLTPALAGDSEEQNEDRARAYSNRAEKCRKFQPYEEDDRDSAISDYTKAIQTMPNNDHYYTMRGLIYSGNSVHYSLLGIHHYDRRKLDYHQAAEDFNKAIELRPDYEFNYKPCIESYKKAGEKEKAKEIEQKFKELKKRIKENKKIIKENEKKSK